MTKYLFAIVCFYCLPAFLHAQSAVVSTASGQIEGSRQDELIIFRGIPYAQPPVGALRWQEPQPVKPWKGVRKADHFGPRAPQRATYRDMVSRSEKEDEDCLYLNIWTPNSSRKAGLPVLVYFHGGGLSSGDGSELRYDGAAMAKKGIVVVTVNYRLGIFGFFAHPELSKASAHHSSGNYGFLDQRAALQWVRQNIAAFGGDPGKVTIAGQSAGSISVSALMASPLSKGFFRSAIGQSGSILASLEPTSLQVAEQYGLYFDSLAGTRGSLEALRAIPADKLQQLSLKPGVPYFSPVIDGYFLPQPPMNIYATGLQADIPLLAGWTSAEANYQRLFGREAVNADNYRKILRQLYGDKADEVRTFYPDGSQEELQQSATDLASDRFIVYGTWKWTDLHAKTSGSTVYRYFFAQKPPLYANSAENTGAVPLGAPHSFDIDYVLGNLASNGIYAFTPGDYALSAQILNYMANFIKTGNPNGEGLPEWPGLQSSIPKVMVFDGQPKALPEQHLRRFVFMDQFYQ